MDLTDALNYVRLAKKGVPIPSIKVDEPSKNLLIYFKIQCRESETYFTHYESMVTSPTHVQELAEMRVRYATADDMQQRHKLANVVWDYLRKSRPEIIEQIRAARLDACEMYTEIMAYLGAPHTSRD